MNSLSIDYPAGTVPNISVQISTANGSKIIVGDVDSGSDRSLCTKAIAADLGLGPGDLVKNDAKGMPAAGELFDTWSTDGIAVKGQIVLPDLDTGEFVPWGPLFAMDLAFADEAETLLLGQKDFFAAFDLHFLSAPDGPTLEIAECRRRLVGP